ncbi:MAG: FISUMP domain-containing protein [Lentimicrobium sp.]
MKKLFYPAVLALLSGGVAFSQNNTLELTFTGVNNTAYFQTDSIKIRNLTLGGDTVLVYPDTVLMIQYVGIDKNPLNSERFMFTGLFPNPVNEKAIVSLNIPGRDMVSFRITDLPGRLVWQTETILDKGQHSFCYIPAGKGVYMLSAVWRGKSSSIKILSISTNSETPGKLEYTGSADISDVAFKRTLSGNRFIFYPGDKLMYIGFGDNLESALTDAPEVSQNYTLQFATNIPCPGLDSLLYDGKYYHTIQIFSQCWLKENLNAGTMIQSTQAQTNNNTIEKYCMGNDESYCDLVGGLYFWNEMMQYTSVTGGQGICPEGWHVPDDMDWHILEGAVDSEFHIGDTEWGNYGWRGADAGGNLKQTGTSLWEPPNSGSTDAFGFSALPGGYFVQGGFWGPGYKAYFWSSENGYKFYRNMDWDQARVNKNTGGNNLAISVRCVKD